MTICTLHNSCRRPGRRGRKRRPPTVPRADPGVQFSPANRRGSSVILASAIEQLVLLDVAITRREVGMLLRLSRPETMFPLQVSYHCQPLSHVDGSPDRRVLWADPTSHRPSALLLWVRAPTSSWINP